ncbi:MAG: FHA domain-containing protein [Thermoguttaceae bacterium]|jgi:pSer/pThr/pTyr-binding forkhead associated (FHA) protein
MKIELTSTDSRKRKFVVDQFPVIVGLDPGADICLDDSAVGHHQCMIDDGDEGLMVWDLGTQAGTLINGLRVAQKSPLLPGDELTIGRSTFVVNYEHAGPRPQRHVAPPPMPEARPSHPPAPRRREPAIS